MNLFKKSRVLFFIFFATSLGNMIGSFFDAYPQWLKTIFGSCIYISLYLLSIPLLKFNFKSISKISKFILWGLFVMGVVAIIRGVFAYNSLTGNKYITLFFNPTFAPIFFLPLFSLYNSAAIIKDIPKYLLINVVIICSCVWIHSIDLRIILPACMMSPLMNKKGKTVVVILALLCVYVNMPNVQLLGGGTRKLLVVCFFACLSYLLVYIIKSDKIILITSIAISILPLAIIYANLSGNNGSLFAQLSESTSSKNINAQDSRTFLYQELALDITNNNAWIWGKGAYSSYYSAYFAQDSISGVRGGIEVTLLLYLLRSGIVYVVFLIVIMQRAIYSALYHSRSKWLVFVALNINGFYLNAFAGDFCSFDLTTVLVWVFIGLCLNKNWLDLTDTDIKKFLIKTG